MTDLATRTRRGAEAGAEVPRPVLLGAALGAGACALGGALVCAALAVVGWIASDGGSMPGAARIGLDLWLLAHRVPVNVPGGTIAMAPLGLTLLTAVVLWRAGRWVAETCAVRRVRDAVTALLGFAVAYGGVAVALALLARTPEWGPDPGPAFLAPATLAVLAGGVGMVGGSGLGSRIWPRLPEELRAALAGGPAGVAALVAGGGLVLIGSLAVHGPRMIELADSLGAGVVGAALLVLLCLAFAPNAAVFAVSFAAGPGFAVGTGTAVAPTGVQLGRLPAFPLLAALPADGVPPAATMALVALPLVAGVVAGVVAVRRYPVYALDLAALRGALAGVTGGAAFCALAAIAGGSIGPGRLSATGPLWWQAGLVCALALAIAGAAAAVVVRLVTRRRSGV